MRSILSTEVANISGFSTGGGFAAVDQRDTPGFVFEAYSATYLPSASRVSLPDRFCPGYFLLMKPN